MTLIFLIFVMITYFEIHDQDYQPSYVFMIILLSIFVIALLWAGLNILHKMKNYSIVIYERTKRRIIVIMVIGTTSLVVRLIFLALNFNAVDSFSIEKHNMLDNDSIVWALGLPVYYSITDIIPLTSFMVILVKSHL